MDKVPNTKRIIWGAKVDNTLTGKVRVMAVLTGVESPFIAGESSQAKKEEVEEPAPEPPARPKIEPPKPKPVVKVETPKHEIKKEEKSSSSYIWIGLILLIILILLWYFINGGIGI